MLKFRAKQLAKLIAGENQCRWAAWFLGSHSEPKNHESPEEEARLAQWMVSHNNLLWTRAQALRSEGFSVTLEDANAFSVQGKNAILTGKPDLIAINDGTVIIEDMKAGKRRVSDHVQVGIYMLIWGPWYKDKKVHGAVVYHDGTVPVLPLDKDELSRMVQSILEEPQARPSRIECRWCPLTECPHRVRGDVPVKETDLF